MAQETDEKLLKTLWKDARMSCAADGDEGDCEPVAKGGDFVPITMDVTKGDTIDAALATITSDLENRDIPFIGLVNNAGVSKGLPLEFVNMDDARWVFEVNVFGVLEVQKRFIPLLRQSKGRIVNIGSMAGIYARELGGIYSGTKFALEALSDSSRRELRVHGVSVSLVEPAFVRTEIAKKQLGDNAPAKALSPEQYAVYAMFLDNVEQTREKQEKLADSTECTNEAIIHALTHPQPKTRYVVANVGGIPAWILRKVIAILPDRAADLLGGRVNK